jgi:hypothetical protein
LNRESSSPCAMERCYGVEIYGDPEKALEAAGLRD